MFSQRLKALRESDGLSQTRFAQEIGFSQSAISAWENDTRDPGIEALIQIARFFNVSVDYLVGNIETAPKREKSIEFPSDAQELVDMFLSLSSMHRTQVLEYARYFTERENATKRKKY